MNYYLIKFLFATLLWSIMFLCKAYSQDVVVTKAGDTIRCRVTAMDSTHLSYQINNDNTIEKHKIPLTYVSSFFPESHLFTSTDQFVPKTKSSRFSISASLGYAKALGRVEKTKIPELDRITQKLTNGLGYELELDHYFSDNIGIGIFLNGYFSSVNDNVINDRCNRVSFGAAFVAASKVPDTKFVLDGLLGLGPIFFTDKLTVSYMESYKMSVTSVAMNFGIGGAYMFGSKFATGLKLSCIVSSYSKFVMNGETYTSDEPYNLSHLMMAVYCRF
ncbi:MAG: hypothetical protein FWG84_06445 [Bacteroidales bacterium]|nr:hypothetical protein [Bacteroidales bacterium]